MIRRGARARLVALRERQRDVAKVAVHEAERRLAEARERHHAHLRALDELDDSLLSRLGADPGRELDLFLRERNQLLAQSGRLAAEVEEQMAPVATAQAELARRERARHGAETAVERERTVADQARERRDQTSSDDLTSARARRTHGANR